MTERPSRYPRTFSGMLGSMVVLVVLVVGVVAFQALRQSDTADPVVAVDYRAAAAFAEERASFEVAVPSTLPAGWIATSALFTPGNDESWHLGMLTEDRHYVGIEQAVASARTLVRAHVDEDAEQGEDVTVDGVAWQTWTDDGGDTALVHESATVTTLIVGTVDRDVLVSLVRLLPPGSVVP